MKKSFLFLLVLFLLIPLSPKAEIGLSNNDDVFKFLKEAFEVQVSLSEKPRPREEIIDLLNGYFSKKYQKIFWNENIFEEDGGFLTYGSDFSIYYIPYFQYSDDTKVIFNKNTIYIFEYFPASTEGPVGYDSHYEGILVKKINGEWKVDQYLYNNIPESILKKVK